MSEINDKTTVKQQYATSNNLSTRISIHDKYSTNKQGFGNWIFSNYKIEPGMKILELGCGTGDMWKNREKLVSVCSKMILSDFSSAMVNKTKENIGEKTNIEYKIIDIQDIPYEDNSFDVVIANMMLYHVPDIEKGLKEVRRVLKPTGYFYSATYGEHGIIEYLSNLLSEYGFEDNTNKNFTLQNGFNILKKTFTNVEKLEYKDSLAVTDTNDMVEYIYSLSSMTSLSNIPKQTINNILQKKTVDGVLNVPKEYGMFICN